MMSAPPSRTPPNVIHLEGEIDNVEQCLVKMPSIVAGEPYFPTGVIVQHHPTVEKEATKLASSCIVKEAFSENNNKTAATTTTTAATIPKLVPPPP
jgi:hypothetical protein